MGAALVETPTALLPSVLLPCRHSNSEETGLEPRPGPLSAVVELGVAPIGRWCIPGDNAVVPADLFGRKATLFTWTWTVITTSFSWPTPGREGRTSSETFPTRSSFRFVTLPALEIECASWIEDWHWQFFPAYLEFNDERPTSLIFCLIIPHSKENLGSLQLLCFESFFCVPSSCSCARLCVHTHIHTHTRTHARTHTHTHTASVSTWH